MIRWLMVIFILIATFSIWIFFSGQSQKTVTAPTAMLDAYMVNAHYIEYDHLGQVHMSLNTPKMTHYAKDSTSYFDNPRILVYSQQRIPWTIRAAQGKAIHSSHQVDLWGNVIIHQASQPGYPETTIATTAMTIYPPQNYAETSRPVTITRPDMSIEAVGMQANFKTGIFKLLSLVRGNYEPAPQPSRH